MVTPLTDAKSCCDFLEQAILKNLYFWQSYLARHSSDTPALEQEWEGLVKGIFMGLRLEPGWSHVYKLITALAGFMERQGYWDVWREVLSRALTTAPLANDAAGEVTLAALLARLSQRQGRYAEMIAGYRRVMRLARRQGDRFNEARACTNLGYFYIEHGRWQRAEVLCCYALQVFEQLNSDHGRAHTENHLGVLYTWHSRWAEAEQHLHRACAIWQASGDSHGLMYGFMNLGTLYIKREYPNEALFYSKKALEQANLIGDELEIGRIYVNMGLAYSLQGELTTAEVYTRQAEAICKHFFNLHGLTDVLENLGLIYRAQQRWSEAIEHLERALQGWRTLNNKQDEVQTLIHLAECELAKGNQWGTKRWLKKAEDQLRENPETRRYYQLPEQLNKIRRSLRNTSQATTN